MLPEEKKEKNRRKIKDVIKLFREEEDIYRIITEFLYLKLQNLFPHAQSVESRVKSRASIAGKVLSKFSDEEDAQQIYRGLTDLSGGRIIFLHRSEVDAADTIIRGEFKIDDHNSQDTASRLNTKEFGYLSKHYIICINQDYLNENKKFLDKAVYLFCCKYNTNEKESSNGRFEKNVC